MGKKKPLWSRGEGNIRRKMEKHLFKSHFDNSIKLDESSQRGFER